MQTPATQESYVLIVDDNEEMCQTLARLLKRHDFVTRAASDGDLALSCILQHPPAAMILDYQMERVDGICLLARLRELEVTVPVIMLTAYPAISDAVKAIKLGACDYLAKPFDHEQLLRLLRRLINNPAAKNQAARKTDGVTPMAGLLRDMGPSRQVQELVAAVGRVAKTDFSVLIVGETGAGKELLARAIHAASARAAGPFVAVDCGAISESLFENELFGHEKGSFTGAIDKAAGKFEAANRGTLFLDEVSNLPASAQPKILRALEQRAICRLGANHPLSVDLRIVAATNVQPQALIEAGRFRLDLFYRLNEFVLRVPPLHERREDIPYLANRFLTFANAELGKSIQGFSAGALELLSNHGWPGNVRELRHVVRQAALAAGDVIDAGELGIRAEALAARAGAEGPQWKGLPLREVVRQHLVVVERRVLTEALRTASGNKAQAARMLQIDYKTIHQKLKEYGIHPKDGDSSGL
ncbi:MAG TPA: sigma-54 dependent transcriptional regulator [Candidatus Binataceae bacterium]|jgi:two-component system nitrogen regulation response regulator GlnG|nr:sigma-54 dependent transcriptional regulator [Candidatus Binataceae bacterium]